MNVSIRWKSDRNQSLGCVTIAIIFLCAAQLVSHLHLVKIDVSNFRAMLAYGTK